MTRIPNKTKAIIYGVVFFSGFANLATEIIGPRLVASLFGSTTILWAIIISITLIGISIGYWLGGRVSAGRVIKTLPFILIFNAAWLLLVSWIIWKIPSFLTTGGYFSIVIICFLAFFPPAVLFSMTSPLVISLIAIEKPQESIAKEVGNIYALGTLGSVLGALVAAFILIPYVGLTASLKLFSIGATIFALVFLSPKMRAVGALFLVGFALFPLPIYRWGADLGLTLLAQTEGYYQTIRVFTDQSQSFIQMNLGPTFHTQMRTSDQEPVFGYAAEMIQLAGNVEGKRILIIGGAGHTQARALEKRGAIVTEVEIDPFVVRLSDRYFGEIHGSVIVTDGRAYLAQYQGEKFDFIFVDAFDSLASVPPQLITQEFFSEIKAALQPDGQLIYNFIGVAEGSKSNSFRAISTTMSSVFSDTRASKITGDRLMNIVLVASNLPMSDLEFPKAPQDGDLITDDLNPGEIYFEQARAGSFFH